MSLAPAASVAFLLGIAGDLYCTMNHICMEGHFAHPEMITPFNQIIDVLWVSCFIAAIVLGHFARCCGPRRNVIIAIMLLFFRGMGSFYGFSLCFEFPLALLGVWFALATLIEHRITPPAERECCHPPIASE